MGFIVQRGGGGGQELTSQQAGAELRWCPLCGSEYLAAVQECAECVVPLVDQPPLSPDDIGDEEGDQIAYEFDDLTAADRYALDREVAGAGIVHAWDGTTLLVAPYDEEEVDRVLGTREPEDVDRLLLDDDAEQVVYDLSEWDDDRVADLDGRLEAAGIAHAFDEDGDLVVLAADEERVDAIVDAAEFPDQLAEDGDDLDGDGDGVNAIDVVGDLFVAADRLSHSAVDSEGVIAAVDAARTLVALKVPFGFSPPVWDEIVARAAELRRLLETDSELVDDAAVVESATRLRNQLRPLV